MKFHNDNVMHISEVSLKVKDLVSMKDFYLNILGFSILFETDNKVVFSVNKKDPILTLIEIKDAIIDNKTVGLYHIAYLLPTRSDLASFVAHIYSQNVRFQAGDHLVSEAIYLSDPENNGIEVYVDRNDSLWNWKDDNVDMATLPVDFDNLLREDIYEYKLAPNDMIIGHLHLQVNDISENRKFYEDYIGFKLVSNIQNSALFLSDNNYHHHIAFNIWAGRSIKKLNENNTGIKSFVLSIPKDNKKFDSQKTIIDPNNIEIIIKERGN